MLEQTIKNTAVEFLEWALACQKISNSNIVGSILDGSQTSEQLFDLFKNEKYYLGGKVSKYYYAQQGRDHLINGLAVDGWIKKKFSRVLYNDIYFKPSEISAKLYVEFTYESLEERQGKMTKITDHFMGALINNDFSNIPQIGMEEISGELIPVYKIVLA